MPAYAELQGHLLQGVFVQSSATQGLPEGLRGHEKCAGEGVTESLLGFSARRSRGSNVRYADRGRAAQEVGILVEEGENPRARSILGVQDDGWGDVVEERETSGVLDWH